MSMLGLLGLASMVFVAGFTFRTARAGADPRAAIIEAWFNIVVGFTVNFVANLWLIPLMTGVELPHGANFWGGWIYTTISIVRQYAIRRWFHIHDVAARVAARLAR